MKLSPRFGVLTGLLVGLWNISCFTIVSRLNSFFSIGIPPERIRAYSGLFGLIILILGIYLGIKAAKRKSAGVISYGQAVKTGVLIAVITAAIVACFGFLYCTVINPGYTNFMVSEAEKTLIAAKKAPAEIAQQLERVRNEFSTGSQVLQALIVQSVVGTISSLIISATEYSKKPVS